MRCRHDPPGGLGPQRSDECDNARQRDRDGDGACQDPLVAALPVTPRQDALEGVRRRLEALDGRVKQVSRVVHDFAPKASRNADERDAGGRARSAA